NLIFLAGQAVMFHHHFELFVAIILVDLKKNWAGIEGLDVFALGDHLSTDAGDAERDRGLLTVALVNQGLLGSLGEVFGEVVFAFAQEHFDESLTGGLRWRR